MLEIFILSISVKAKERRDDSNPDSLESLPSASSYKAVAPGIVDP